MAGVVCEQIAMTHHIKVFGNETALCQMNRKKIAFDVWDL